MEVGVRGYQEGVGNKPAEGELRYVQMSVERATGKVRGAGRMMGGVGLRVPCGGGRRYAKPLAIANAMSIP